MKTQNKTVDEEEVAKFSAIASEWWNPHGKFAPLHRINPLRIEYIRDHITAHFRLRASDFGLQKNSLEPGARSPEPLTLLDIGCGGGLICEPMARLGAQVTGIDASEKNIAVAKLHAQQSGLEIDYRCMTAEELASGSGFQASEKFPGARSPKPGAYDVVLALEIIEHVADVEAFIAASCQLVKPGGMIFYSTINRTVKSFALAIVGAEYVLRWLPKRTHDWKRFLRPHELVNPLRHYGMEIIDMTGMVMNPLTWQWRLDADDLSVNYLVAGKKTVSNYFEGDAP